MMIHKLMALREELEEARKPKAFHIVKLIDAVIGLHRGTAQETLDVLEKLKKSIEYTSNTHRLKRVQSSDSEYRAYESGMIDGIEEAIKKIEVLAQPLRQELHPSSE